MSGKFRQFALWEENGIQCILFYADGLRYFRAEGGVWKKSDELTADEMPMPQDTHDNFYAVDKNTITGAKELMGLIDEATLALGL
mgnify:CR=1 FL=1